jgi:hypothetical protein
MESKVPAHMLDQQRAVENEIREAFKGVSRAGGVSWNEAEVIDGYGTDSERAAARASDTDQSWEELVDDANWDGDRTYGAFNFLDSIGYRYYIAPAMIQCARQGCGEFVAYALTKPYKCEGFTESQARATARFLRFMIDVHVAVNDHIYGAVWRRAYESHWREWDSASGQVAGSG